VTYERGARLITGSTYLPGWSGDQKAPAQSAQRAEEIPATPLK
jgi:hypothetical protein